MVFPKAGYTRITALSSTIESAADAAAAQGGATPFVAVIYGGENPRNPQSPILAETQSQAVSP
jgi:hypothetical protein